MAIVTLNMSLKVKLIWLDFGVIMAENKKISSNDDGFLFFREKSLTSREKLLPADHFFKDFPS